jgi:hypothetical protein
MPNRAASGGAVEKFTATPRGCRGYLPLRRVIVGVGPPSTSDGFRGGLCYLDAVEPEPRGPALKRSDWRALTLGVGTALVQRLVMEQPRPFSKSTSLKRCLRYLDSLSRQGDDVVRS